MSTKLLITLAMGRDEDERMLVSKEALIELGAESLMDENIRAAHLPGQPGAVKVFKADLRPYLEDKPKPVAKKRRKPKAAVSESVEV